MSNGESLTKRRFKSFKQILSFETRIVRTSSAISREYKLSKISLPNGAEAWSMSASKYIQNAIGNLEKVLAEKGMKLRNKVNTPLSPNYRPECDLSEE